MKFTEEQIQQQLNNTLGELWAVSYLQYTPYDNDRWVEYYNNEQEAINAYNKQKEAINAYNKQKEQEAKETHIPGYHIIVKEPVRVEYLTLILSD